MDFVYLGAVAAMAAALWGLVALCDTLRSRK